MHYYIDGYNLLFRTMEPHKSLQTQRNHLIKSLSKVADIINLNITLVFDATHFPGESSRSHFHNLEVIFTPKGQTADDFILQQIKTSKHPTKETVVTSDIQLSQKVRLYATHTETVEHFLSRIKKQVQNKQRKKSPSKTLPPPPSKQKTKKTPQKPSQSATPQECFDYYLSTFEERATKPTKQKHPIPPSKSSPSPSAQKKKPKTQKPKQTALSEMERWRQIFERKINKKL